MSSINIRLSPADAKVVGRLRRNGENVSEIARQAFRAADNGRKPRTPASVSEAESMIAELLTRHSVAVPEYIKLGLDITDRKQARAYLKLRRERKLRRKAG